MNDERETNMSENQYRIAELIRKFRATTSTRDRRIIQNNLERLTGGGVETKVVDGHTRFIPVRVDEEDGQSE